MSNLRLTGSTSGYVELASNSVASNNTLKLPNSGDSLVAQDASGNLNISGIITASSFSGNITGNVTGTATGLSGTPAIQVSSIGVNTTIVPTKLYVSGNSASNIVALGNTDATTTLNLNTGNNFSLTLTGNIILANPTGLTTGQSGIVLISQDGTGSRTCGFGSFWDFPSSTAPTLTTTANGLDCLTYFVRSTTSIVTNSLIGIGTL